MRLLLHPFVFFLFAVVVYAIDSRPRACIGNLFSLTGTDAVRTNRCVAVTRQMVEAAASNARYPNISWDYIRQDEMIDTHGYPFYTAALARGQIERGCDNGSPPTVMIGPNEDNSAAVAAKVVGSFDTLLLSPLARSPALADVRTYPNFYRTASSFVNEVEALLALVRKQGWTRLAVIYSQDEIGQMVANQVPQLTKAAGYPLDQIEVTIPADDLGDATRRVVDNIRNLRYRVILLHASERIARLVLSEMLNAGMLNGDFIVMGTTYWTSSPLGDEEPAFSEDEKKALKGTIGLRFGTPAGTDWDYFLGNITAYAPQLFYPYHLDPVNMAIKNCVDAVNVAIEAIVSTVRRGLEPTPINVWKNFETLEEFDGVDGRVSFSPTGDSLTNLILTNFRGGEFSNIGTFRQVQRVESATLKITTPVVFPDDSIGWTSDEVPRHLQHVPSWAINLSYAFMAFGLMFNIALHRLVYQQRAHEIIKASSPLFCHIIIAGSSFAYLLTGIGSISPDFLCRALPGCVAGAFSIIFGSLFAKTWRIHRIFNSRTLSRKAPTNRSLLIIVAALLSFEGLIQIIWMSTDLPEAIVVPHSTDAFASVEVCHSEKMTAWWTLSLLPKVLVLLFGIYVAYKVRLLNHNFNEAKHISMAVYNVVLMCLLMLPLALLFEKDPTASYLIRTIGPMFASVLTLCLLFVPKFWDMFVTHDWVEYVSDAIYENGVLVHKSSKHSRNSHGGNSHNGSQLADKKPSSGSPAVSKPAGAKYAAGGRPAYLNNSGSHSSKGHAFVRENSGGPGRPTHAFGAHTAPLSPKGADITPGEESKFGQSKSLSNSPHASLTSLTASGSTVVTLPHVVNTEPRPDEVIVEVRASERDREPSISEPGRKPTA